MSPEDGPPPLDDFDEDGPPPLDEFEEAERKPKQSDGSLLGLEEKIDSPWAAPKPESSSAAHDALITKLQAKPKEKKEKKQKEQEAPAASFVVGDTVEIHGLTGAAQHNGKTGVVQGFDEAKGRYAVALTTGGKKPLAIKPANLAKHKPPQEEESDGAVAGEANGYGTVAVDLAAEHKKIQEMKKQGLNPDGTPYIHLPGKLSHPCIHREPCAEPN